MRKQQVGLMVEYIGYLVLLGTLFTVSTLVGLVGLGAVLAFYGIKLRYEGRGSARSE